MSGFVTGLVLAYLPFEDHAATLVAIVLGDAADDDGMNVYPSVPRVARLARVSERTVQYKIRDFLDAGFLLVVTPGGGRKKTTEYRIDVDWLMKQPRRVEIRNGAPVAPIATTVQSTTNGAPVAPYQEETVQKGCKNGAPAGAPDPRTVVDPPLSSLSAGECPVWICSNNWNPRDKTRLQKLTRVHGVKVEATARALALQNGALPFLSEVAEILIPGGETPPAREKRRQQIPIGYTGGAL